MTGVIWVFLIPVLIFGILGRMRGIGKIRLVYRSLYFFCLGGLLLVPFFILTDWDMYKWLTLGFAALFAGIGMINLRGYFKKEQEKMPN